MDQGTLVEMQIEDGKRLLDRLVEQGVPVTGAGWLKEAESGQWFLYIVTPLVGVEGATRPAYRRVNAVIRQIPEPLSFHPLEIKVVEPGGPIGKAIQDQHRRYPGQRPTLYRGDRFGDLSIEGAYIYPPTVTPAR